MTPIALIGRVPMRLSTPTASARSGLFAPLPLAAAAGSPGIEASVWFGLLAPANLHAGFRARLHAAVQHALSSDDLQRVMRSAGGEVWPGPPEAFATLLASERRRYESLARDAHLQPD